MMRALWGPEWIVCLFPAGASTATTGHRFRPLVHPRQGSKEAIIAPGAAPGKVPISREKPAGVNDARPLGAVMDSSAFACSSDNYCHNGRWPSPPSPTVASSGSKNVMMAPAYGPQKSLFCRGKSGRSAIRVLWAGMDSSGKKRRPVYKSLVANGFPPGVAADDCVALRFDGTELA
jgi:hypothetical protein